MELNFNGLSIGFERKLSDWETRALFIALLSSYQNLQLFLMKSHLLLASHNFK